jgi:glyoxylase-like metal-dependent hydrolase (beta-lactamase superfamily II)
MIIGFFLFFVMRAMGELLLSDLNFKSFADFAGAYIGPARGVFPGLVVLAELERGGGRRCGGRRLLPVLVPGHPPGHRHWRCWSPCSPSMC